MTDQVTDSSGNVFTDLGLEDAEGLSLKAALAFQVTSIIKHRHLSQTEAGAILGIPQSHVSKIINGKLDGITADRLLRLILNLGRDIDIVIRKRKTTETPGRLSVESAGKRVAASA